MAGVDQAAAGIEMTDGAMGIYRMAGRFNLILELGLRATVNRVARAVAIMGRIMAICIGLAAIEITAELIQRVSVCANRVACMSVPIRPNSSRYAVDSKKNPSYELATEHNHSAFQKCGPTST